MRFAPIRNAKCDRAIVDASLVGSDATGNDRGVGIEDARMAEINQKLQFIACRELLEIDPTHCKQAEVNLLSNS